MMSTRRLIAALLFVTTISVQAVPTLNVDRAMSTDGTLAVRNLAGDVSVRGWSKSSLHIGGALGSSRQRLKVTGSGDHVKIQVIYPHHGQAGKGAHLIIDAPVSAALVVATVSADVSARGMQGKQQLRSVSGDVQSDGAGASINARSVSGGITLDTARDLPRHVALESTSGALSLAGTPTAGAVYRLNTVSGDLHIALPTQSSVAYDLRTTSGHIHGDFGPVPEDRTTSAGSSLIFKQGSGSAGMTARSVSGDVFLRAH